MVKPSHQWRLRRWWPTRWLGMKNTTHLKHKNLCWFIISVQLLKPWNYECTQLLRYKQHVNDTRSIFKLSKNGFDSDFSSLRLTTKPRIRNQSVILVTQSWDMGKRQEFIDAFVRSETQTTSFEIGTSVTFIFNNDNRYTKCDTEILEASGTEKRTQCVGWVFRSIWSRLFRIFQLFTNSTYIRSGLLVGMKWSVCISRSQRILRMSGTWTDSGLCTCHLLIWSNFNLLHNSQWMTFPTQLCQVL